MNAEKAENALNNVASHLSQASHHAHHAFNGISSNLSYVSSHAKCALDSISSNMMHATTILTEKSRALLEFTHGASCSIKSSAEQLKTLYDKLDEKQKYAAMIGVGVVTVSVIGVITSSPAKVVTRDSPSSSSSASDAPSNTDATSTISRSKPSSSSSSFPFRKTSNSSSPSKSWLSFVSWGREKLPDECTVSAPGKILIAGGYLVLKSPNLGLVLSSTARFFTTVKCLSLDEKVAPGNSLIIVESPQFHQKFEFEYSSTSHTLILKSDAPNKFVEKCLFVALAYVKEHLGKEKFESTLKNIASQKQVIGVQLRADNDFYSQIKKLKKLKRPLLSKSLQDLPSFVPCLLKGDGSADVAKTGLGSSAAMTVSLVGALLEFFDVVHLQDNELNGDLIKDKTLIHNLSQIAHSVAQEKCGSGFDISAAVYGSQKYVRFDANGIQSCLESNVTPKVIHDIVHDKKVWNQEISFFNLPPGMSLIMGDICGGSPSPSMAKSVLQWLKDKPMQSQSVWAALSDANRLIYEGLSDLNKLSMEHPEKYAISINSASKLTADKWSQETDEIGVFSALQGIRKLFKRTRFWLKRMGDSAGVSIEPDASSALADRTESLAGVLCAGVPGAGGFDALYTIVLSEDARNNVEQVWCNWETSMRGKNYGTKVCPLTLHAESVDGDKCGVVLEKDRHC